MNENRQPRSPGFAAAALILAAFTFGSSTGMATRDGENDSPRPVQRQAHAHLKPRQGTKTRGHATFRQTNDGVVVDVHVSGAPMGTQTASLLGNTKCIKVSGKAWGKKTQLGKVKIDRRGRGHLQVTLPDATLSPSAKESLIDDAVLLQAKDDDVHACGQIRH